MPNPPQGNIVPKTVYQSGGAEEISIASLAGSPAQKAAASGLASLSAGSLVVQKPADRLSKTNFEITLNKLLKGAGAGADPTEIDVPTGATTFAALTDVKVIRKTADETVNNSVALQNDDALLFAVEANSVWEFIVILQFTSGSTPNLKVAIVVPAAASFIAIKYGYSSTAVGIGFMVVSGTGTRFDGGEAALQEATLVGVITNGANAGNFQIQWAQNTAEVSDTKVRTNSCIIAHKLA